jgi:hypothetical protein
MARISMAAEIAALKAEIAALKANPVKSAPATFATSAQIKRGEAGVPCTADKPCTRVLHTAKRAALHGVATGGHEPR